ncbi:MAG TPA: DUF6187 family protein [Pseudonocardiaceae bacterium]|nr:DUF6187 family protein [Pseudonocardiaceae bacterium]
MAEDGDLDTRFGMPAVDQPALTEVGVILSGLDTDRLLAGLGVATAGNDPTAAVLRVDQLRHGDEQGMADAVVAGAQKWLAVRDILAAKDQGPSVSASIRQAWARALRTVRAAENDITEPVGLAGRAYLAACWLRCTEVDRLARQLPPRHSAVSTR